MLAVLPTEVGVIVGGTPVCVPFHVPTVGLCPGMLPPPPTAVGVVIDGTPYCFLMPSIGFCQDPFGITVPPPPGSIGVVVNGFPVCVP
jgi:hypothetical protein